MNDKLGKGPGQTSDITLNLTGPKQCRALTGWCLDCKLPFPGSVRDLNYTKAKSDTAIIQVNRESTQEPPATSPRVNPFFLCSIIQWEIISKVQERASEQETKSSCPSAWL